MHRNILPRKALWSGALVVSAICAVSIALPLAESRAAIAPLPSPATLAASMSDCCDNRACDDPLFTCKVSTGEACAQASFGSGYTGCNTQTCH
jgi:hypothetical protein